MCDFFGLHHILMSSVIYYWTDAQQHGIYLLNRWFTFFSFPLSEWKKSANPLPIKRFKLWYVFLSFLQTCFPGLHKYFKVGSLVQCNVLEIEGSDQGQRKIKLSLDPKEVNSSLKKSSLKEGMVCVPWKIEIIMYELSNIHDYCLS